MSDSIEGRRFSDREVREILERAVRSTAPGTALRRQDGMSLAELRSVAAEVGIDPARLDEAARAVVRASAERRVRLLGAPRVLDFERTVDGTNAPGDTPEILSLIRGTLGHRGDVAEIHGSLEWSMRGELADRHVTLTPRDGRTTIRASSNLTNATIVTWLPPGMVGLIASFIGFIHFADNGSTIGLVVALAVLPVLFTVLRLILKNVAGAEAARMQTVVDELARFTSAPEPEADGTES